MNKYPSTVLTWLIAILALGLFTPLFAFGGIGAFDFWWWMASNAAVLIALVFAVDGGFRKHWLDDLRSRPLFKIGMGLASAALLYFIFYFGNLTARWMFAFAARGIEAVYDLKQGASPLRVGLLIGFLIGPAEELFWRGFLQRRLALRYGRWFGFAAAVAVYTLMHLASLNPMLVIAACVCGMFWGLLYLWTGSLLLCTVSHIAWDLTVFLIVPLS